jgi:hypothetical protein
MQKCGITANADIDLCSQSASRSKIASQLIATLSVGKTKGKREWPMLSDQVKNLKKTKLE